MRPKYLITDVDNYFIENGFFLVFSLFCVGRAGTDRSLRGESTRRKLCFQARDFSSKASRRPTQNKLFFLVFIQLNQQIIQYFLRAA